MMKKTLRKISLSLFAVLLSMGVWSQCPAIICPGNIEVWNDYLTCNAVVNYTTPIGIDTCFLTTIIYNYTGTIDTMVVPEGVTNLTIEARGAAGGNSGASVIGSGLGASMKGDFIVVPGQVLKILVGQQNNVGNGGGGGTFVVDNANTPLIIAGGGGGAAELVDSPEKHGKIFTNGGLGAGGGGVGGTNGNGGNIGASFASGAGGGLLTNGADGWVANTGGNAFVNGGAGANVGWGVGGFGGGGNGTSSVVGGGGGGYSGGGAGSNSLGGGVGGGGGSINNGTNQVNTGGINAGNGIVIITIPNTLTTTLYAGIGSGGTFPVGISTEIYKVVNNLGDSALCSFTVTVLDSIIPTIVSPASVVSCDSIVYGIAPTVSDNCGGVIVNYKLLGATTGSGSTDASGTTFNVGLTTIWYIARDASGNQDSSSFTVTINALDDASFSYSESEYCVNGTDPTPTITGLTGGTFTSGSGLSIDAMTGTIDISASTPGPYTITYTTSGLCPNTSTVNLTLTQVDTSTTLSGLIIISNAVGATYQWLDCNNGMGTIIGETDSSYTATINGNYAVQVTVNGCVDTSDCVTITTVGIIENSFKDKFVVYPNPSDGNFSIAFEHNQKKLDIQIYSISGELLAHRIFQDSKLVQMELNQPAGIYNILILNEDNKRVVINLVKK